MSTTRGTTRGTAPAPPDPVGPFGPPVAAARARQLRALVDRLADEADKRTGGKHSSHIERGAQLAKDKLGDQRGRSTTPEAGPPA